MPSYPAQTAAAPLSFSPPSLPVWTGAARRWLASALCVFLATFYSYRLVLKTSGARFLLVFVIFLIVGAAAVHVRHAGAQMLTRSALWSTWLLGAFLCLLSHGREQLIGAWLLLPSAVALLALGGRGIFESGRRRSHGLGAWITTASMLAVADTVSLVVWSGMQISKGRAPTALCLAALMLPAVYGLYRMKGWGLRYNVVANVLVVGVLASGLIDLHKQVILLLVSTAVLQIVVAGAMKLHLRLSWRARAKLVRTRTALSTGMCVIVTMFFFGAELFEHPLKLWAGLVGS